ncbi:thymidine phosphorylase [Colwellia sp. MB02u-18]|uniref:thymidine phosphorylase n=1 Tax=unclassified Colwellia TaxID=196834 RepID=UPI0015F4AA88|nr:MULTISPECIES: thymidine phosphorylase [unclassified Colwellia]MBA6225289.1 thymidine phosphorylase [Colwellia sp. MB3u-45]MBA6267261.1 thymidine phosphorylase [Colwellia sp. MB3u-43]MBA6322873.1 thymidine phosphorylase [Colwellia sp. MB02u-19]MBA6324719.1 thymidine phosphorylase [Colwellia sp. MB02u-18]MBA6331090.1 thymidine phosphorylase [Colwellia sp. MB02u-12]
MLLPQEIIRTKRDGGSLSQAQIQSFVDGLVTLDFNDAQAGSMAMAIFQKGMQTREIIDFTMAMKNSGDVLSWPELDGPVVDKHSTGGVGDKVSFMLAAIVAACGAYVPMIAGRGLGHTGGTADKLESIAGFNVQPSIAEFKAIVKDLGMAIISQTDNLAPADKRLYGIRDITATVESIPLITASILSKKLAAGLDTLVMDVKVGNGAMMSNIADAKALAQSIVNVANGAGVPTQAIITDMNQVLGATAGNALEMAETVKYLTGSLREPRLHGVVVALAKAMLVSAKVVDNEDAALVKINHALTSGAAAEIFSKMIHALGGPSDFLEDPWRSMQRAACIKDVIALDHGYINAMQTRDIGLAVVGLKGGRTANGQQIDHSVGFDRVLPIGTLVNRGDVVARVHARDESSALLASLQYQGALVIDSKQAEQQPVIYQTISA